MYAYISVCVCTYLSVCLCACISPIFSLCVYTSTLVPPACVCEERDREGKVSTLIFLYQIKNVLLEENILSNCIISIKLY